MLVAQVYDVSSSECYQRKLMEFRVGIRQGEGQVPFQRL